MSTQDLSDILGLPQKRSLADDVVERLREAIWSERLAPDQRLREEVLAEFLGVSRGPVREALTQLEREGLVIKHPNRGAIVARLSREDLEEVFSLRMALEQFAIRQAVRNADADHMAEMQALIDTMSAYVDRGITPQEAAKLDLQFHEIIYKSAKHKRLHSFWSILRPQIHIFLLWRNVANPDFRIRENIIDSHQALLDAIRDRDEARAVQKIEEHLYSAYERILNDYARRETVSSKSSSPSAISEEEEE